MSIESKLTTRARRPWRVYLFAEIAACVLIAAVALGSGHLAGQGADKATQHDKSALRASRWGKPFAAGTAIVITADSLASFYRQDEVPWQPAVSTERPRGGVDVYAKVAPAVAVVRTAHAHGTGFFVQPDGTLVTNHHVIASGLRHDPARGGSYARVHTGRLGPDGMMQLAPEPLRALVLKVDPVRDLALLRVVTPTPMKFPSLGFATAAPRPGLDCAIVGHPGSGMLWAYRPGQVSGVGQAPRDLVTELIGRLAVTGPRRALIEQRLAQMPSVKLLLSSTGAGPGDSGGPVVDSTGALLGVTYAVTAQPIQARFTHHVHLDELRQFLAQVPTQPTVVAPNPWAFGPMVDLADLDGGQPDVLIAGTARPEILLIDLDNDSPPQLLNDDGLDRLVAERKWDFEVAIDVRGTGFDVFYDTNNDGTVDLIMTSDEPRPLAKERLTLVAGKPWRVEAAGATDRLLSPAYFKDGALAKRLASFRQATDKLLPW